MHLKADLIKNFEAYDMINRALIFGSKRDCVNICLTWKDSLTGEKKISQTPLIEKVSTLYNIGVCCMHIAAHRASIGQVEDLKVAIKNF